MDVSTLRFPTRAVSMLSWVCFISLYIQFVTSQTAATVLDLNIKRFYGKSYKQKVFQRLPAVGITATDIQGFVVFITNKPATRTCDVFKNTVTPLPAQYVVTGDGTTRILVMHSQTAANMQTLWNIIRNIELTGCAITKEEEVIEASYTFFPTVVPPEAYSSVASYLGNLYYYVPTPMSPSLILCGNAGNVFGNSLTMATCETEDVATFLVTFVGNGGGWLCAVGEPEGGAHPFAANKWSWECGMNKDLQFYDGYRMSCLSNFCPWDQNPGTLQSSSYVYLDGDVKWVSAGSSAGVKKGYYCTARTQYESTAGDVTFRLRLQTETPTSLLTVEPKKDVTITPSGDNKQQSKSVTFDFRRTMSASITKRTPTEFYWKEMTPSKTGTDQRRKNTLTITHSNTKQSTIETMAKYYTRTRSTPTQEVFFTQTPSTRSPTLSRTSSYENHNSITSTGTSRTPTRSLTRDYAQTATSTRSTKTKSWTDTRYRGDSITPTMTSKTPTHSQTREEHDTHTITRSSKTPTQTFSKENLHTETHTRSTESISLSRSQENHHSISVSLSSRTMMPSKDTWTLTRPLTEIEKVKSGTPTPPYTPTRSKEIMSHEKSISIVTKSQSAQLTYSESIDPSRKDPTGATRSYETPTKNPTRQRSPSVSSSLTETKTGTTKSRTPTHPLNETLQSDSVTATPELTMLSETNPHTEAEIFTDTFTKTYVPKPPTPPKTMDSQTLNLFKANMVGSTLSGLAQPGSLQASRVQQSLQMYDALMCEKTASSLDQSDDTTSIIPVSLGDSKLRQYIGGIVLSTFLPVAALLLYKCFDMSFYVYMGTIKSFPSFSLIPTTFFFQPLAYSSIRCVYYSDMQAVPVSLGSFGVVLCWAMILWLYQNRHRGTNPNWGVAYGSFKPSFCFYASLEFGWMFVFAAICSYMTNDKLQCQIQICAFLIMYGIHIGVGLIVRPYRRWTDAAQALLSDLSQLTLILIVIVSPENIEEALLTLIVVNFTILGVSLLELIPDAISAYHSARNAVANLEMKPRLENMALTHNSYVDSLHEVAVWSAGPNALDEEDEETDDNDEITFMYTEMVDRFAVPRRPSI